MKFLIICFFTISIYAGNEDQNLSKGNNMNIDNTIYQQWERLFKYYGTKLTSKCEGVKDEDIHKVEKELGVSFPKTFSDSFKICDQRLLFGSEKEYKGWLGKYDLFSIKNSYDNLYNLVEANRKLRIYDPTHREKVNWVVFYTYEFSYYVILDTNNGYIYLREAEEMDFIKWADSYEEWFKIIVDEVVKYGELRLETIEELIDIE